MFLFVRLCVCVCLYPYNGYPSNFVYKDRVGLDIGARYICVCVCVRVCVCAKTIGLFYRALLQKRPTILRSLLIVATP